MKLGKFDFVCSKLEDLKYLKELINLNDTTEIEDLMKDMKTYFNEKYRITTTSFQN